MSDKKQPAQQRVNVRIVKADDPEQRGGMKPIAKADGSLQISPEEAYTAGIWTKPPFDLRGLSKMVDESTILPQCIRAYKSNIAGFGIDIRYKVREICCPKFYPDQIVHWMMILVLEPVFMRGMCETNCGSVPGRGAHYGKKHIEKWYKLDRKNTKYCAKLDIRKFYPSSKAPAVMQELRHVIKCKRMLRLCETVLNSSDGLPIGNYTSQWFANFLLQRLDHFIKEVLHIRYFVRYMDDMCLWASSKKLLHRAVKAIEKFLAGLGLVLKANWQIFPTAARAVDFLGFRFFREKTTLRKNLALRLRRRVKKTYKHTQKTGRVRARDAAAVMSYCGWLKHAHCHGFFVKYVKPYVNFKKLKEAIRHEARIRARTAYCVGNAAQPRTV